MLAPMSARDSNDPHGYVRLREALLGFARELAAAGHDAESDNVRQAAAFYGGSPSEFLGESRSAMLAALASGQDLPGGIVQRMRTLVAEIDEGFRAVGGG
jgi:hypothetical protein